jgi:hypothetical protein
METKEIKQSKIKAKNKLIECKNCHQDIAEEKMFLHEGFCTRNNVYCVHCKKVFLKKDYEEHNKSIQKKIPKNTNSPKENQKTKNLNPNQQSSNKADSLVIEEYIASNDMNNNNYKQLSAPPCVEYIQIPLTEYFQINNPIIIENGQIVSKKNKNDFLLPHLGINAFQNSKMGEQILDEMINQGDMFKENNDFISNSYSLEGLQNLLRKNSLKNSNPQQTLNDNNYSKNIRKIYSFSESNEHTNINGNKKININSFNQKLPNDSVKYNNNYNNSDIIGTNSNVINNKCFNEEENLRNKNIIINNNIMMPYNTNTYKQEYKNYNNLQQTPKKKILSNILKYNSFLKNSFENNKNSMKPSNLKANNRLILLLKIIFVLLRKSQKIVILKE